MKMGLFNTKKKDKTIQGNLTHIVIYRELANNLPVAVAEFDAQQEKDDNYNLVLVNENEKFKEDISFVEDPLVSFFKYKLDLIKSEKSRKEKIDLIEQKIAEQQKLIKSISDGFLNIDGKKTKVNRIDEENKLTIYKILKYDYENKGDGSYEIINTQGQKEIHFLTKDGVLIPYFHKSSGNLTKYPDLSSKRKIYKEVQDMIDKERLDEQKDVFGGVIGLILKILLVVMLVGNIIAFGLNMDKARELSQMQDSSYWKQIIDMADGSSIKCAYYYSKMLELRLKNETESNKEERVEQVKDTQTQIEKIIDFTKT